MAEPQAHNVSHAPRLSAIVLIPERSHSLGKCSAQIEGTHYHKVVAIAKPVAKWRAGLTRAIFEVHIICTGCAQGNNFFLLFTLGS